MYDENVLLTRCLNKDRVSRNTTHRMMKVKSPSLIMYSNTERQEPVEEDVPPPPPGTFYDTAAQAEAREKALATESAGASAGPFGICATATEGHRQQRKGGKLRVVMIGSSPSKSSTKADAARAKHRAPGWGTALN